MEHRECNGWTNYETWVVSLWMDNEEGSQRYWQERAEELMKSNDNDKDTATSELAGLCNGVGKRGEQVCIEAAICEALDEPHGDEPECVEPAVRTFKIALNDKEWSSPNARARGLRDAGLAQLGSKGVVNGVEFAAKLAERTIRVILPKLFRRLAKPGFDEAADRCEKEGTRGSALFARDKANAAYAANAAAYAANARDEYLALSAQLAVEVLRELGSPGVKLLDLTLSEVGGLK